MIFSVTRKWVTPKNGTAPCCGWYLYRVYNHEANELLDWMTEKEYITFKSAHFLEGWK